METSTTAVANLSSNPLLVSARLFFHPIDGSEYSFIVNPLSGSVDLADSSEVALLQNLQQGKSGSGIDLAFAKQLRERKLAFCSREEEDRYLEERVERARSRFIESSPSIYTICPTLACNLACSYCFEGDSLTVKPQGVMTDAQVDAAMAAIAQIDSCRPSGGNAFDGGDTKQPSASWLGLFGGEPLLPSTLSCVEHILAAAESRGMVVACTTNGVNIRYFESLLTRYSANFGAMQITLDGPQKIHDSRRHRLGGQGTFREIVDGIEILAGLKVRVHIRVNLDADNIDFLPQLCEFIDGRGWSRSPHIDLAVAAVSSHTESGCKFRQTSMMSELDIHKRLLTLMREYPVVARLCRPGHLTHLAHLASVLDPLDEAARRNRPTGESGPRYWYCEQGTGKQWVFTPDGHIYTCPEAVGQPSHAIGRFDPVLNLWREPAETWLGKTILSEPKCKECQISTLCGGGCQLAVHERVRSARLAQVDASASSRIPLPMSSSAPFSVYADSAVQANEKDQFCVGVEEIVREYLTQVGQRFVELGVIPS